MAGIDEGLSLKIAIGLVVTIVGIILSWLWLMQQQLTQLQVTDSDAVGKISVLETNLSLLRESGSATAQHAIIDVEKLEQIFADFKDKLATKEDVNRIEKRLDRIEQLK